MQTSDILIQTTTIDDGNYSTDIDFTAIGSVEKNDCFELHVDDTIVRLNISEDMSIGDFTEWVARNCNADYDLYNKALTIGNTNILNITTKNAENLNIDLDYHQEG